MSLSDSSTASEPESKKRKAPRPWPVYNGWRCPICNTNTTPNRRRVPDGRICCNKCGISILKPARTKRALFRDGADKSSPEKTPPIKRHASSQSSPNLKPTAQDGELPQRVNGSKAQKIITVPKAEKIATSNEMQTLFANAESSSISGAMNAALKIYRQLAAMDYAPALYRLGVCYEHGTGVPANPETAFEWYEKASSFEMGAAEFKIGEAYRLGSGVDKDEEAAAEWYREAVDHGDVNALYELGRCHERGLLTDPNAVERAVDCYRRAADAGHVKAMTALGQCLWDGRGVAKDQERAMHYLTTAAGLADSEAQRELGTRHLSGTGGVSRNEKLAFEWIERAAMQGNAEAQLQLGSMYAKGDGCTANIGKARSWVQKAAEQGLARAESWLGIHLLTRDAAACTEEALLWLNRAATQDNARALYMLGHCYEHGTNGVATDEQRAHQFYARAASLGECQAMCALGRCLEEGVGCARNEAAAVECYLKCVQQGQFAGAMERLARCYREGRGVPQDLPKAAEWTQMATERAKHERLPLFSEL